MKSTMANNQGIALNFKLRKRWGPNRRRILEESKSGGGACEPAHLARMMATAIRFEEFLSRKLYRSFFEMGRAFGLSWAQMFRIMSLTLLAPDLQEALLKLRKDHEGADPIGWRGILPIVENPNWCEQRKHPTAIRVKALASLD